MHVSRIVVAAVALLAAFTLGSARPAAEDADLWVVDLDGAVGPATAAFVTRAIDDATDANAQALVIRMDTPGGLDASMREIVKAILAARIPVITYVAPDGARAASAGTYIAFASHIAAMSPASNIGSSTPVSIAPAPETPKPTPTDGDDQPEQTSTPDAMTRKVVNDAAAYLKSLAELRGRNVEWAEETVRDGVNLRASAAVEQGVVDLVAASLPELLATLDGREVDLGDRTVTLETADASVHQVPMTWRDELLSVITDPSIAYGLLIFGIYGLILEFYNPGLFFPAILGVICLLLGAYGLQMLPINYAGLALLAVGIGLMIMEVVTPTFGVAGVGGAVAFVIGSIMLMDTDVPAFQLPIPIIMGVTASIGLLVFLTAGAAVRARAAPVVTGTESMIGGAGQAIEGFDQAGTVRAFGEIWQAQSRTPVRAGQSVRITSVDGLVLTVEPDPQHKEA